MSIPEELHGRLPVTEKLQLPSLNNTNNQRAVENRKMTSHVSCTILIFGTGLTESCEEIQSRLPQSLNPTEVSCQLLGTEVGVQVLVAMPRLITQNTQERPAELALATVEKASISLKSKREATVPQDRLALTFPQWVGNSNSTTSS